MDTTIGIDVSRDILDVHRLTDGQHKPICQWKGRAQLAGARLRINAIRTTSLGSSFFRFSPLSFRFHNQNMTVAARAIAGRNTVGDLSQRVAMRCRSLSLANSLSI